MRSVLLSLAAASVLILPAAVRGEEAKPHGRPDPETLFQHLDKNHDGVITADEVPDNAPPPLKALLKAADKKGDKRITKDEFLATVKEHRETMHHAGPGPAAPGPRCGPAGGPAEHAHRPGPGMAGPPGERKPLDLKALFASLDKDKDGKLSLDEFTAGMKNFHEKMMARFNHREGPPSDRRGPMAYGPRPEGPPPGWHHGPGCPCCERGPMAYGPRPEGPPPGWHRGPGCPCCERGPMPYWRHHEYRGGEERGRHGDGHQEGAEHRHHQHEAFKALEAKVKQLDAKLKALEAKLTAEAPKKPAK